MILFAAGERHLKAGRVADAKAAFEKYLTTYGGDWRVLAESRLRDLSTRTGRE